MQLTIFSLLVCLWAIALVYAGRSSSRPLESLDLDRSPFFLVQVQSFESQPNELAASKRKVHRADLDRSLLAQLKNRRVSSQNSNDGDDDQQLRSMDVDKSVAVERRFFLFPSRRTSRRSRPNSSYGRKAHWDTFFG